MTLSPQEIHIIEHAVGWEQKRADRLYRNHFCAGPGHDDWDALQRLCAKGLMRESRPADEFFGGDSTFCVTNDGLDLLEREG